MYLIVDYASQAANRLVAVGCVDREQGVVFAVNSTKALTRQFGHVSPGLAVGTNNEAPVRVWMILRGTPCSLSR